MKQITFEGTEDQIQNLKDLILFGDNNLPKEKVENRLFQLKYENRFGTEVHGFYCNKDVEIDISQGEVDEHIQLILDKLEIDFESRLDEYLEIREVVIENIPTIIL